MLLNVLSVAIPGGILLIAIIVIFHFMFAEKRQWNGGICRKCGNPWVYSKTEEDYDMTEKRIYICKKGHICEMPYNFDKKRRKDKKKHGQKKLY